MRVFISSTVYELIDVRAELAAQLTSMGITPVLSDDKLSDFRVQPDADSIETCLVNVASCDEMILILDRRYGPSLAASGYPDVSATHLEYQKAVELKMPIHVYVRDRLEAEFGLWKRNGRADAVKFTWVGPKDFGLFRLLDEHSALQAKSSKSNWYSPFTSSIDLKAAVSKYFETRILPERVTAAIQINAFPILDVKVEVDREELQTAPVLMFRTWLLNVSGGAAFDCRFYWDEPDEEIELRSVFLPGQSLALSFIFHLAPSKTKCTRFLIGEYTSPIGVSVRDRFRVQGYLHKSAVAGGGILVERTFRRSPPTRIQIADD